MKHYLTFTDGTSNKFWQIETNGTFLVVKYGKIGTAGTIKVKTFRSETECSKEAEKLLNEKLKQGYTDSAGGSPAKASKQSPKEMRPVSMKPFKQ